MQKANRRKAAILISLLLATGSAWAEWVKISDLDAEIFYIDPATIRKTGNHRKVWTIRDFKARDKYGAMSQLGRVEYDCANNLSRMLSFSIHSGRMATGTVVYNDEDVTKWYEVAPNTSGARILKIVCGQQP